MSMLQVRQPHIKNNRFQNAPDEKPHNGVLTRTALMWAQSVIKRAVHRFSNKHDELHDPLAIYTPEMPTLRSEEPKVTWIGHATFLIQIGGMNILTDPVFGSPTPFFGRNAPPGIVPTDLPPIDVILISHNHMDHMHGPSLQQLFPELKKNNGQVLVPFGDDHWFKKRSFDQVTGFHWGERKTLQNLTFTFLPARHWSRRGMFDRNKSLWGSWMIEYKEKSAHPEFIEGSERECKKNTIYFAGDSAYADHFSEIRQHFPNIDVALMPIAPCEPDHIMREMHMNAEESVQAYLDLNAQSFIPMHWHTFNFGHDTIMTPLHRLQKKWELQQLPQKQLIIPNIGLGVELTGPSK